MRRAIRLGIVYFAVMSVPSYCNNTGGFSTATGSTDTPITASTLSDLESAVAAGRHHIIIKGSIYGGSQLKTIQFDTNSWDNTTIEGEAGGNASLVNIELKFDGEKLAAGYNLHNIVVKNISFHGVIHDLQSLPTQSNSTPHKQGTNYEGISLRRTSNALIDHCSFFDMSDDLISVALESDFVTISYNKFYFTTDWLNMNPDPLWNWVGNYQDLANERLAMLVGASPSDSYAYGNRSLHVTLHHNWIGPLMKGRPLLRGFVHAYNNYFDNSSTPNGTTAAGYPTRQYNAIQIGSGGLVISENNYFYKTRKTNQIGLDKPDDTYGFYERNNIYDQVTEASSTGSNFSGSPVEYSYVLDAASDVPQLVQRMAGPH